MEPVGATSMSTPRNRPFQRENGRPAPAAGIRSVEERYLRRTSFFHDGRLAGWLPVGPHIYACAGRRGCLAGWRLGVAGFPAANPPHRSCATNRRFPNSKRCGLQWGQARWFYSCVAVKFQPYTNRRFPDPKTNCGARCCATGDPDSGSDGDTSFTVVKNSRQISRSGRVQRHCPRWRQHCLRLRFVPSRERL